MRTRVLVRIEGIVQGVGFRPFVHSLASRLELVGFVANDSHGVRIEVEGEPDRLQAFLETVERQAPPLAVIERFTSQPLAIRQDAAFVIEPSERVSTRSALVSPDIATCDDCLREILDPADRRYRYAFTNCTNCGPRFTITRDVPYDRATTTMAGFVMCEACAREYEDPRDRRFHAQPVACPTCGPRLAFLDAAGRPIAGEPVSEAARALLDGGIVAVKGLGGYHLATVAADAQAVAALRARKHREEKPFAVMAADVASARGVVVVSSEDEVALAGRRRPIVLLPRLPGGRIAPGVAPGHRSLGVMLPYTPLHHLLLREVETPIVLTSGNVSDEPIAYRDAEARERLRDIADRFLTHDRAIQIRTDDSVVRSFRGTALPVRRSRGYAPQPVTLPVELREPLLACGAELKNTICVAKGHRALISHHLGDLENYEVFQAFTEAITHFCRLFDVEPAAVAHDLHPEYLSTKWAQEQPLPLVGVQHHHAHIASCLADNGETGRVIGVAFDGLGYGTDGTLWGGEFLLSDLTGFTRVGHLAPVPMPGATTAIREPWRMAAVYLDAAYGDDVPPLPIVERHRDRWAPVLDVSRRRLHAPLTSSAGRLFDAVAAILGVRDQVSYEGQAAIELEQVAAVSGDRAYSVGVKEHDGRFVVLGVDLVRGVVDDALAGVPVSTIAARFHESMAVAILEGCRTARARSGLATTALSGGVFQNVRLLGRAIDLLEADGFRVLRHRHVPPNDGGISLGQAVVAAHRIAADLPLRA
jgi:hydrogenase maturation protein HypF